MRALDVGCGPGALTAALAARLGNARVAAADPSEPFTEACRWRLPGVEVVVANAEALPPLPTGVAPPGAFCKSLDRERRGALQEAYRRHLGVDDGPFELSARAWVAAGAVHGAP